MPKLLIICGPTATGKTKLAVTLAQKYNGELVSADSRQVYIGMDIGTGKDIPQKSKVIKHKAKDKNSTGGLITYDFGGVPIWLYDVVRPDEAFSVAHYQILARDVIADIQHRGKLPILVGGTGLYIQALLENREQVAIPSNSALREKFASCSVGELQRELKNVAPHVFDQMNSSDQKNPRRLLRKLEIATYLATHQTAPRQEYTAVFESLCIGLTDDLKVLYQRIDTRVDERVTQGIEEEIKRLLTQGYHWDLPAMTATGYRQWQEYFEQKADKPTVIQKWKYAEHAYARKQRTWFRKQKDIFWYDSTKSYTEEVIIRVREWLESDI